MGVAYIGRFKSSIPQMNALLLQKPKAVEKYDQIQRTPQNETPEFFLTTPLLPPTIVSRLLTPLLPDGFRRGLRIPAVRESLGHFSQTLGHLKRWQGG